MFLRRHTTKAFASRVSCIWIVTSAHRQSIVTRLLMMMMVLHLLTLDDSERHLKFVCVWWLVALGTCRDCLMKRRVMPLEFEEDLLSLSAPYLWKYGRKNSSQKHNLARASVRLAMCLRIMINEDWEFTAAGCGGGEEICVNIYCMSFRFSSKLKVVFFSCCCSCC